MSDTYPPPGGDEPWDPTKVWPDEPVPPPLDDDPDDDEEEVTDREARFRRDPS